MSDEARLPPFSLPDSVGGRVRFRADATLLCFVKGIARPVPLDGSHRASFSDVRRFGRGAWHDRWTKKDLRSVYRSRAALTRAALHRRLWRPERVIGASAAQP